MVAITTQQVRGAPHLKAVYGLDFHLRRARQRGLLEPAADGLNLHVVWCDDPKISCLHAGSEQRLDMSTDDNSFSLKGL